MTDPAPMFGDVLEFSATGARRRTRVQAGAALVDGLTVGAVTHDVLCDREHLARDGMIVAELEIVARGVNLLKQASEGESAHLVAAPSALAHSARGHADVRLD